MVILEGIRNGCIIIGTIIPIVLSSWALAEGIAYLGDLARWWKNS